MIRTYIIEDTFLMKRKIEEIKNAAVSELLLLDSQSKAEDISASLRARSFFSESKIIVYKNVLENLAEKESQEMMGILPGMKDSDIYFFETKLHSKSKLFNWLKKNSDFQEIKVDARFNLVDYIKTETQRTGGEISPLAAERLASFVGPDLWRISEEINKLVNYKRNDTENTVIDTSDITELVAPEQDLNIFNLIDAFATKNKKRAAELVDEFINKGINELYILAMISKQFRNIAMAKMEPQITDGALAKRAGLHPFVAKKTISQSKSFSANEIRDIYNKIIDAEIKLKSGRDSRLVLLSIIN